MGYYVTPTGTSDGDGTSSNPWDLETALNGGLGTVQPGDTIWLRAGKYTGAFTSTLTGTASAHIVVRQYPGERATVDGKGATRTTLTVDGAYTIFWGFELINSSTDRTSQAARPDVVYVRDAANVKLVHMVVRDGGVAIYTEPTAGDVEIYGCLIYNNGWQTPDRGSGHAIYVKSDGGPRVLRDNVMFNQFGFGVHAYSNAGAGLLQNIRIEGNVSFNNGSIAAPGTNASNANLLMGGEEPADNSVVAGNMTYASPGVDQQNVRIGYPGVQSVSATVQDNYLVGGDPVLMVEPWTAANVTGNTLFGASTMVFLTDANTSGDSWSGNQYYRDPAAMAWRHGSTLYTLSGWQVATGLGATDQATVAPSQPTIFVRPSLYEPGRATVIVYNWSGQASVSVDLSQVLVSGDRYDVRNVQNFFGSPVTSGTYGGAAVSIPMAGVTPPAPIGGSATPARRTGPAFDVFVVSRPES